MMSDDHVPVGKQTLLPGIPEKIPGEHYIPTTAGGLKITKRQDRFAYLFARSGKRAKSAELAGFSSKNAGKIANELLQKTQVLERVDYYEKEYLAELDFSKIGILSRLAKMSNADPRKIYNEDGSIKPPTEWGDNEAFIITGLEVFEEFAGKGVEKVQVGRTKKVKTIDPLRAVELGMKHFGLLTEKVEFPDDEGKPQSLGLLGDLDRATRLMFLIERAKSRKDGEKAKGEDGGDQS